MAGRYLRTRPTRKHAHSTTTPPPTPPITNVDCGGRSAGQALLRQPPGHRPPLDPLLRWCPPGLLGQRLPLRLAVSGVAGGGWRALLSCVLCCMRACVCAASGWAGGTHHAPTSLPPPPPLTPPPCPPPPPPPHTPSCVIDTIPHSEFTSEQYNMLIQFAELVVREIEKDKVRGGGGGGGGERWGGGGVRGRAAKRGGRKDGARSRARCAAHVRAFAWRPPTPPHPLPCPCSSPPCRRLCSRMHPQAPRRWPRVRLEGGWGGGGAGVSGWWEGGRAWVGGRGWRCPAAPTPPTPTTRCLTHHPPNHPPARPTTLQCATAGPRCGRCRTRVRSGGG